MITNSKRKDRTKQFIVFLQKKSRAVIIALLFG